jgi:hypothetical protein
MGAGKPSEQRRRGAKKLTPSGVCGCLIDGAVGEGRGLDLINAARKVDKLSRHQGEVGLEAVRASSPAAITA